MTGRLAELRGDALRRADELLGKANHDVAKYMTMTAANVRPDALSAREARWLLDDLIDTGGRGPAWEQWAAVCVELRRLASDPALSALDSEMEALRRSAEELARLLETNAAVSAGSRSADEAEQGSGPSSRAATSIEQGSDLGSGAATSPEQGTDLGSGAATSPEQGSDLGSRTAASAEQGSDLGSGAATTPEQGSDLESRAAALAARTLALAEAISSLRKQIRRRLTEER